MPELPEVETVRRGLEKLIKNKTIAHVDVKQKKLRIPVPAKITRLIKNAKIQAVRRRAKFLLLDTDKGTLISHLGMTGSWRREKESKFKKHDHCLLHLTDNSILIYNDPRRFGVLDMTKLGDEVSHSWLSDLGVEPLNKKTFTSDYIYTKSRKRSSTIKSLIMDQKIVVGIGNIYAAEALFRAGIRPSRRSGKITRAEAGAIVRASQLVLAAAIKQGGTTIRNFRQAGGSSGYFQVHLDVYGREGEACRKCGGAIRNTIIGGRSSFWCSKCQK